MAKAERLRREAARRRIFAKIGRAIQHPLTPGRRSFTLSAKGR